MRRLLLRVAFFGAVFSLQCCVNVLGTISRDTIFLRSYKASSVAALTLLLSFSTAVVLTRVTAGMGRLKHQLKASNGLLYALCPAVLAVGLLLLSLASLGMPQIAFVLSVLIYGWLDIATQVLTQQFWDLCARAFDVSQAKKYFGYVAIAFCLSCWVGEHWMSMYGGACVPDSSRSARRSAVCWPVCWCCRSCSSAASRRSSI